MREWLILEKHSRKERNEILQNCSLVWQHNQLTDGALTGIAMSTTMLIFATIFAYAPKRKGSTKKVV